MIYRTFKKRRRRKRSLVRRKLRSFIQNLKRYACIPHFFTLHYIHCNQVIDIQFNSRYIQNIWRVVLRRTRNYARTSFGTKSRFIDSNRSHFRSTSYIQNLKRYVKSVRAYVPIINITVNLSYSEPLNSEHLQVVNHFCQ